MKKHKKLISLFLVMVFTVTFSVSFSAAEVNNELAKVKLYIRENVIQPQTAEDHVIYEKTTLIYADITANLQKADMTSATSLADTVIFILATGGDEVKTDYDLEGVLSALTSMQNEDGSFGSGLMDTCKAMIALSAVEKEFNADQAAKYLIKLQSDDGSFTDLTSSADGDENLSAKTMHDTYWAVAALSVYTSTNSNLLEKDSVRLQIITAAKNAVTKTLGYIKSYVETEEVSKAHPHAVAYAILTVTDAGKVAESDEYGNLMSFLLKFANEDGSFRLSVDGEEVFDRETTVLGLRALEAIRYGASEYKSIGVNGGFNKGLDIEGLMPIIEVLVIIAGLSIAMWVLVFVVKRPKGRTLDEFKESVRERIPKASEEDMDISEKPTENEE